MISFRLLINCFGCYLLSCSGAKNPGGPAFFEGSIRYDVQFTRKTDKFDSLMLHGVLGRFSTYYYKEGNNVMETPGAFAPWGLYRVADNKAYTIRKGVDTVYWESCGGPGDDILNYTVTKGKETVLGILCDELRVEFKNKTVISYYNPDTLKINPELHKAITASNEDFYAGKKKALSLKFIIDKPDYTVTYTASKISHAKLDDSFFSVPDGLPLVEFK